MLTPEQAATALNIPAEMVELLVESGRLRLAIETASLRNCLLIEDDDLTLEDIKDVQISENVLEKNGRSLPDYIYLDPVFLKANSQSTTKITATNSFQLFDGTDVQIFSRQGFPKMVDLNCSISEIASGEKFSLEEIERYRDSQAHETRSRKRQDYRPFQLPLKVEPAAEAMVDLGNRYYEEHGCVPTGPARFRKYMCQNHDQPWEVIDRPNGRRGEILIESKPISYESFNKRFKQYQENNGR